MRMIYKREDGTPVRDIRDGRKGVVVNGNVSAAVQLVQWEGGALTSEVPHNLETYVPEASGKHAASA